MLKSFNFFVLINFSYKNLLKKQKKFYIILMFRINFLNKSIDRHNTMLLKYRIQNYLNYVHLIR